MVSILITHYQRPDALINCLDAISKLELKIPYEIVVSDDCSDALIVEQLRNLEIDQLLTVEKNRGLASSLNRGIKACNGDYILYCQEDFFLKKEIVIVLQECFEILDSGKLDMIRFTANYKFNKLLKFSEYISRIPDFSFANFHVNTFRYSDNPFIVKSTFYDKFGYYLEDTSGPYGETEFAIRMLKLKAKIGITNSNFIKVAGVASIMNKGRIQKRIKINKKLHRFLRALRQHLEWLLYNPTNRKLFTFKNKRGK